MMTLLLPWWREDPCEVHVRHHDHRDRGTEGSRDGLVLLPEKVVFELEKKRKFLMLTWFPPNLVLIVGEREAVDEETE